MTINAQESLITRYKGDGIQYEWPINFPFLSVSDVSVHIKKNNGDTYKLILDVDYLIDKHSNKTGGTIQAKVEKEEELIVYLDQQFTQDLDLQNNGILDAEMLEYSLDKLTLLISQVRDRLNNCVSSSVLDSTNPNEIILELKKSLKLSEENYNSINTSLTNLRSNIESLKTNEESLKSKLEQTDKNHSTLNTTVTGIENKISELKTNDESLKIKIEQAEKNYSKLDSTIIEIDNKIKAVKPSDESLKTKIEQAEKNYSNLNTTVTGIENKISELKTNDESLKIKIEQAEKNYSKLDSTIIEIDNKIKAVKPSDESLKTKIEQAEKNYSTLNTTVTGIENKINELKTNDESLKTKIEQAEQNYSKLDSTIIEIDNKIKAVKPSDENLKTKIEQAEKNYYNLNTTVNEIEKKVSELKSNEKDIKSSLEESKKWANNPHGTPVTDKEYSAYHWAMEAKKNASASNSNTTNSSKEAIPPVKTKRKWSSWKPGKLEQSSKIKTPLTYTVGDNSFLLICDGIVCSPKDTANQEIEYQYVENGKLGDSSSEITINFSTKEDTVFSMLVFE